MEDNALRYRPDVPGGHVESYFLKANSPGGHRALWIKHTVLVPAGRPQDAVAEVWALAFHRGDRRFPIGLKATVPFGEARFRASPFLAEHPNAVLEPGRSRGEILTDAHHLRWSLDFTCSGDPYRPFPFERMYEGGFPRSKTLTPCPDAWFRGAFEVDGERWVLSGWPGMQGHNWGKGHAHAYAWAHCNAWEGEESAWFEGLSGKVLVGGRLTPWITVGALHLDGETYRFDGPRAMLSREVSVSNDRYRFRVVSLGAELTGVIAARPEEMAGLYYENPDQAMTYCLNSKIASGRLLLRRRGRPDVDLRSEQFALEIGTRDPDHPVRMLA